MGDTCRINPHGTDHYWLKVDQWLVCLFCETEQAIRQVETIEVKEVYL